MSTMLDDFQHMDVRGADAGRGRSLLGITLGDGAIACTSDPLCYNPIFSLVRGAIGTGNVIKKIHYYKNNWSQTSTSNKRDIVAGLRSLSTMAKYASMAAKIMQYI